MNCYHKIHETGWDGDFRTSTSTTNPNGTEKSCEPLRTINSKVNRVAGAYIVHFDHPLALQPLRFVFSPTNKVAVDGAKGL